jgi:membrane fusion protein, heavy metal efflux system
MHMSSPSRLSRAVSSRPHTFAVSQNRPLHTAHLRAFCHILIVTLLVVLGGACSKPSAAAGEPTVAAEPAGGAITLWTDSTELFMEHPALIVGAPEKFAVHLTDVTDFSPLRSGRLTMSFQPQDGGTPLVVVQETPRAPGIYGPSPSFTRPGIYDLTLRIESPQARDEIRVPGLVVYATADAAPRESGESDGGIAFLKEQQWKTQGFRMAEATEANVSGSFDAVGVLEAAPGRLAHVMAPLAGLLDATGLSGAPVPGQRVSRGQVLARLTPSLSEGGGAAYAEARAALREAIDEHERAKRLLAVEAIPERRLHEAEIRLQAAREALAGYAGGALDGAGRVVVRAPLAGVIGERSATPGSRVDAGAALFTVVDPSVLWLRVNVPAAQSGDAGGLASAEFVPEGGTRRYRATRTISVGSLIDSVSRTIPARFEVTNRDGALKVGATARVTVLTGRRERGVTVPASAILDEDGRAIIYVQLSGERFEKRSVTLGGREGDRVLVRSGVQAGEHVVDGAAYQVRLASLSTAVPAEGHAH